MEGILEYVKKKVSVRDTFRVGEVVIRKVFVVVMESVSELDHALEADHDAEVDVLTVSEFDHELEADHEADDVCSRDAVVVAVKLFVPVGVKVCRETVNNKVCDGVGILVTTGEMLLVRVTEKSREFVFDMENHGPEFDRDVLELPEKE